MLYIQKRGWGWHQGRTETFRYQNFHIKLRNSKKYIFARGVQGGRGGNICICFIIRDGTFKHNYQYFHINPQRQTALQTCQSSCFTVRLNPPSTNNILSAALTLQDVGGHCTFRILSHLLARKEIVINGHWTGFIAVLCVCFATLSLVQLSSNLGLFESKHRFNPGIFRAI